MSATSFGYLDLNRDSYEQHHHTRPAIEFDSGQQTICAHRIFAQKLDEYGMAEGGLAAHRIVHPYATSVVDFIEGSNGTIAPLLFIKRTEKQYQAKNARKYGASVQRPRCALGSRS